MGIGGLAEALRVRRALRQWARRGWLDMAAYPAKWSVLKHRGIAGAPWIETGTFRGRTTEFLASIAPAVTTLEPAQVYYDAARAKFANDPRITVLNGTSEDLFPDLLAGLSGDLNFWLDGHYSGGETFQGATNCPVPQELAAISANLDRLGRVAILIDDIRLFLPEDTTFPDYPSVDWLVSWAQEHGMAWRIEHDIFILTRTVAPAG